jgi:hypothetical protein
MSEMASVRKIYETIAVCADDAVFAYCGNPQLIWNECGTEGQNHPPAEISGLPVCMKFTRACPRINW